MAALAIIIYHPLFLARLAGVFKGAAIFITETRSLALPAIAATTMAKSSGCHPEALISF